MKILQWIFICFFWLNANSLFSQNAGIDIGIHYPISTASNQSNFPFSNGDALFNAIITNPTLFNSIVNELEIADVIIVENEQNSMVQNYPGAHLGGSFTFKNNLRLSLLGSFYSGYRKGENNLIFMPEIATEVDTFPITFRQKQFTTGVHSELSYIFGQHKIHPFLGVGFSALFRKYQPLDYDVNEIQFSDNSTTQQHALGINTSFGVEFNLHKNINLSVEANYQGIQFLQQNFVSIPNVATSLSFVFPFKKLDENVIEPTLFEDYTSYSYFNDSINFWHPQPFFDVPPPADFCVSMDIREKINQLIELLNKLKALGDKTQEELEANDLYSEVQALKSVAELIELLSNSDKIDSAMIHSMTEFMMCNSQPLRNQISSNKDVASSVILPLKLLNMIIGAKMMDKSLPKATRDKLKSTYKYLKDKIEQLEEAVEKGESIDKILEYYDAIKENINWPTDLLESLLENAMKELQSAIEEKIESTLKKQLQAILTKILGNANMAKAIISIGKDIIDLIDILDKVSELEDIDAKWNEALIKIIEQAKEGKMLADSSNCVFWGVDKEIGKVVITAHMRCWCPKPGGKPGEGTWKVTPVDFVDSGGKLTRKITVNNPKSTDSAKIKLKVPARTQRTCDVDKCIIFVDVEIYDKKGALIGGGSMVAGVPSD